MAKNIENPMGKAMVTTQSLLIEAAVITVVVPGAKGIGHREYTEWISDVSKRFRQCQVKAAMKVNEEMLRFFLVAG